MELRTDKPISQWLTMTVILLIVAGCGGGSGTPASSGNTPPVISGLAPATAIASQSYQFDPTASDADGDSLSFSMPNRPGWASFSTTTGALTGTPGAADIGTYPNLVISVSDGTATSALPAFSISVTQIATGSALVSWLPPTENTDGSALTNLAGYRISFGSNATDLNQTISIAGAGITSYVVPNLTTATWYFSIKALGSDGTESDPSVVASKTIS